MIYEKILSLFLVLSFMFVMVACSQDNDNSPTTNDTENSENSQSKEV